MVAYGRLLSTRVVALSKALTTDPITFFAFESKAIELYEKETKPVTDIKPHSREADMVFYCFSYFCMS